MRDFQPIEGELTGPRPVLKMDHPLELLAKEFKLTPEEVKQVKAAN